MKSSLSFTIYLLACSLFLITSCQKQELEQIEENTTEASTSHSDSSLIFGSLKDFEGLKEIFNKPSKEFDFKFNSIRIRNSSDQKGNNTFRIDTSRIISASIGGNLYYTLPVIQISSNNSFDNIVIGDLDSGHMTFHLLRYYYNDSIYGDLVNVKSNGIDKIQIRELTSSELNDFLNKSTYKSTSCYGVTSTFCDWGGETHSAGPNCTQTYTVTQHYCIQTADWWTYYNFINGPGGGNNTGGNPGNEYIDPNDPYTQPITPPEMFAGGLDYHLDLSMAEYNWALTNTEEAAKIMEFLDDNNFSSNSKNFANHLISFYSGLNYDGDIKAIIASGITNTAEFIHAYYNKLAIIVEDHPEYLSYANYFIDNLRIAAGEIIDTHPKYANWFDLTNMWLFELGENPINFENEMLTGFPSKSVSQVKLLSNRVDRFRRLGSNLRRIGAPSRSPSIKTFK